MAQISFDSVGIDIPKKCSNRDACKEWKLSGVLCREKEVKRSHGLMALSRLELYVKAEHPLEESHGMSDKDKVSIDKTSQAYKTLVAERKFEEGIDNNRDVLHQCRFLSIPTDIVALGKPIRVVQSPINPTPGLLHLNILCVPEGLVNKMHYSSWFGKSLCWTSIIL